MVLCSCPDEPTARRLAGGVVGSGLGACVNVIGGIRSIYRWQGEVRDEAESLMIIKTTQARCAELARWLEENHPYDVPEVVALPVTGGSAPYLDWVAAESR